MTKCCKCKCHNKKLNFKILIPEGTELGDIDVFGVNEKQEIVSEYIAGSVRGDWNSDEEEEDPDYAPSDESDIELVYENAHLSKEDIEELESELADIIKDQNEG